MIDDFVHHPVEHFVLLPRVTVPPGIVKHIRRTTFRGTERTQGMVFLGGGIVSERHCIGSPLEGQGTPPTARSMGDGFVVGGRCSAGGRRRRRRRR